jgi:valyl-tRNA synthetase
LQTSQGYIIHILKHFATKLWNITNFVMLFQAVMKFLSRLVEFKILVNWGMVHYYVGIKIQNFQFGRFWRNLAHFLNVLALKTQNRLQNKHAG